MGSNYFGRNEKGFSSSNSSSQSSSTRKGKKSGLDKPKQPQRGLGVAQLEKIRLHSQLSGCNYLPPVQNLSQEDFRLQSAYSMPSSTPTLSYPAAPYGFPASQGLMMGFPSTDHRANGYGDSHYTDVARWHQGNAAFQQFGEPNITRSFFEPGVEGSLNDQMKNDRESAFLGNQSSESSGTQDIDLELRLSC